MKRIILLSLISIFFTCSKKDESKSKDLPITDKGQTLDLNIYEAASVCQCSDDGIEILTKALKIRSPFNSLEQYYKNKESKKDMSFVIKRFNLIREKCLMKFGVQLLKPSPCNNPDKIEDLRKKLKSLGISTS